MFFFSKKSEKSQTPTIQFKKKPPDSHHLHSYPYSSFLFEKNIYIFVCVYKLRKMSECNNIYTFVFEFCLISAVSNTVITD